jgi:S1-C subfamily serine protease
LQNFGFEELATVGRLRAQELRLPQERGVIVAKVRAGSTAESVVSAGALIVAVNDQPVTNLDELYARIMRLANATPMRPVLPPVVTLTVLLPSGQTRLIPVRV